MDMETMRFYYKNGLWTVERLNKLYEAGKITADQRALITAEEPING